MLDAHSWATIAILVMAAVIIFMDWARNHPVIPDVQHTLIHLTVLAASLLSWRSFGSS